MFLKDPDFMKGECGAPVLAKNNGYLQEHSKTALEKTRAWPKYIFEQVPKLKPSCDIVDEKSESQPRPKLLIIEKPERIFVRDAERTFLTKKSRDILITMLTMLKQQFGDYQQTMCYVCSTLMLYFDEKTTFEMMNILSHSPFYGMSGYWRAEAVSQAIDAFTLWKIMRNSHPRLYEHLSRMGVYPDTFIQKWFGGLGVQIIPSEFLIEMWTQFFRYGFRYLFKFALSLLEALAPQLLSTDQTHAIYEVVRLDNKTRFYGFGLDATRIKAEKDVLYRSFFQKVLAGANSVGDKFNLESINWQLERECAYRDYLSSRLLDAARNTTFGRFLETEKDEDDEPDCENCEDGFGEVYCETCEVWLCDECHTTEKGDHSLRHSLKQLEI